MEVPAALDLQFPIPRCGGGHFGRVFGQGRQLVDDDLGSSVPQSLLNSSCIEGAHQGDSSSHIDEVPRPASERVIPVTSWPRRTNSATSGWPIAPLAPATKILMDHSLPGRGRDLFRAAGVKVHRQHLVLELGLRATQFTTGPRDTLIPRDVCWPNSCTRQAIIDEGG
jgi:hypothetical protein